MLGPRPQRTAAGKDRMRELHTITKVTALDVGRLELTFDDGVTGTVDLSAMLAIGGVFDPLLQPKRWASVEITDEGHALVWRVPGAMMSISPRRPLSDGHRGDFCALSSS